MFLKPEKSIEVGHVRRDLRVIPRMKYHQYLPDGKDTMRKICKIALQLLIVSLVAFSVVSTVSAATEMIAIDPPSPEIPNIIGLTPAMIDDIIEKTSTSESIAAVKKFDKISELQRIKLIFPNVTVDDVKLIDDTLGMLNNETRAKKSSSAGMAPRWGGSESTDPIVSGTHNDISKQAALSMGVSSSNAETVGRYALEPDEGLIPYVPSITHFLPTGASNYAETYANEAKNLLSQSQTFDGYRKLAHSLHYVQDLSVPFHTVAYQNFINHNNYENYVKDNWKSGVNYYAATMSDPYYYTVSDVSSSAENLGNSINPYLNRIDSIMLDDPSWGSNTELITMTKDCLMQGLRYSRGTVQYVV